MNTLEITITKAHVIYGGIAVGIVFLGILLYWARKIILPLIISTMIVGGAATLVVCQVRNNINKTEFRKAQVEQMCPEFQALYHTLENANSSDMRMIALKHFLEQMSDNVFEPNKTKANISLTPAQFEVFLYLANARYDGQLRDRLLNSINGISGYVRFNFESQ